MKTINNYIFEKLILNKDVPNVATLEGKLKEICEQCVKDGDFEWYKIKNQSKNKIYIYLPKDVRKHFQAIKSIIEINLGEKYKVKNIGMNLEKSYFVLHI